MNIWIFPGTFDPVTIGHENTIRRISMLCDSLEVAVIDNYNKSPIFSLDERIELLKIVTKDLGNVTIKHVPDITAEYAQSIGAKIIIRGIRSCNEYETETALASYYKKKYPDVETLFLPVGGDYRYYSSSLLKDIVFHNGDISFLVNSKIEKKVREKFLKGECI